MQAAVVWCRNTRLGAGSGVAPALCWELGVQRRGRSDWLCCTAVLCPAKFVPELSWETSLPLSTTLPEYTVEMALPGKCPQKTVLGTGYRLSTLFLPPEPSSSVHWRAFWVFSWLIAQCRGWMRFLSLEVGRGIRPISESVDRQAGESSILGYCIGQDTQVIAFLCSILDLWGVGKGSAQLFIVCVEAERQGIDCETTGTTRCIFPFYLWIPVSAPTARGKASLSVIPLTDGLKLKS